MTSSISKTMEVGGKKVSTACAMKLDFDPNEKRSEDEESRRKKRRRKRRV